MFRTLFVPICAVFLLLLLSSCRKGAAVKGSEPTSATDSPPPPDYILQDVTHYHYEQGVLRFEVVFERGEFYSAEELLRVENCRYIYYDTEGKVLSRGRSKKAKVFSNESKIVAEEDVVVTSEVNGGVLKTGYLEWRGDKSQFWTEDYVDITRLNGDRISGKGMIADLALRYVTIKKNVKGHIREES